MSHDGKILELEQGAGSSLRCWDHTPQRVCCSRPVESGSRSKWDLGLLLACTWSRMDLQNMNSSVQIQEWPMNINKINA